MKQGANQPFFTDKLHDEYEHQVALLKRLDERFKIPINATDQSRLVVSCYDLAIEHHAAILALFELGLYGSAFALLRIQFEALVRAQYLHYCATNAEWTRFKQDKKMGVDFGNMIKSVELAIGDTHTVLSRVKDTTYKIFNSFTHSGFQHLVRRNNGEDVGAVNYSQDDLVRALQSSGSLALLAFAGLAEIHNDKTFASAVSAIINQYAAE